jgi:hypothetical protein
MRAELTMPIAPAAALLGDAGDDQEDRCRAQDLEEADEV